MSMALQLLARGRASSASRRSSLALPVAALGRTKSPLARSASPTCCDTGDLAAQGGSGADDSSPAAAGRAEVQGILRLPSPRLGPVGTPKSTGPSSPWASPVHSPIFTEPVTPKLWAAALALGQHATAEAEADRRPILLGRVALGNEANQRVRNSARTDAGKSLHASGDGGESPSPNSTTEGAVPLSLSPLNRISRERPRHGSRRVRFGASDVPCLPHQVAHDAFLGRQRRIAERRGPFAV
eukprot:TRINITY_DN21269_c0_g1_i1.p1 TRINITY_DN21269_c0_g1~~TRINITY_DN21269_c0_g1_i1.p1  ORF type:complete len:241 (-),score=34.05 TRINITY_DN21269_c0_g1_i1:312-1034(-)